MTTIARTAARLLRAARAVLAFTVRHAPKWLLPVLAACLLIPGPLDELLVIAAILVPVLRSAGNRRELAAMVSAAWEGK